MAGNTLSTAATLQCPHGGKVVFVPGNLRVKLRGMPAVTTADTATIVGCTFAPVAPSPCLTVQWAMPNQQSRAGGSPLLSEGSVGLCLNAAQAPQGPVVVVSAPARVRSR
jgi:hypothetical protein